MKEELFITNQEVLIEDLNFIQQSKGTEILNRITDVYQNGINFLRSADKTGEFKIIVNGSDTTKIDIGYGTAYNTDGERAEILSSESITYDPFPWTNSILKQDVQSPPEDTPYSTGNIHIPLKDYTLDVVNFIFIDYYQTIEVISGIPDWSAPNSKTALDTETAKIKYPYKRNGYRIIVEVLANVTVDSDGYVTHNTYAKAVYLGKVTANGPSVVLTTGDIFYSDTTHKRKYFALKELSSRIQTPVDISVVTTDYIKGKKYLLDDHIRAISNPDLITPNNPHGQTIYDFGYTGADIVVHRSEMHNNGIITSDRNNVLGALYPIYGIPSSTKIRIYNLLTLVEYAISAGNRLDRETIISINSLIIPDYKEFIFSTESVGDYYFYLASNGLIDKTQSLSLITSNKYLQIATVYWDGSLLATLYDDRVFGSIGSKDIAQGRYYQGQSLVPVGMIAQFLSVLPGWLECNGDVKSKIDNPEYEGLIIYLQGLGFGSGDTASLPNMKGRFPVGADPSTNWGWGALNVGAVGGVSTHTHTLSAHTHPIGVGSAGGHFHSIVDPAGNIIGYGGLVGVIIRDGLGRMQVYAPSAGGPSFGTTILDYTQTVGDHSHGASSSVPSIDATGSASNIPPYFPLKFCIKF